MAIPVFGHVNRAVDISDLIYLTFHFVIELRSIMEEQPLQQGSSRHVKKNFWSYCVVLIACARLKHGSLQDDST